MSPEGDFWGLGVLCFLFTPMSPEGDFWDLGVLSV